MCLTKKCTKKPLKVPTEEKCDSLVSSDFQNFEQEFIKTVSVMIHQTFFADFCKVFMDILQLFVVNLRYVRLESCSVVVKLSFGRRFL